MHNKGSGTFRSLVLSLPGTKVPGNFRSRERKFQRTFVPGSERSWERLFCAAVLGPVLAQGPVNQLTVNNPRLQSIGLGLGSHGLGLRIGICFGKSSGMSKSYKLILFT